MNKYLSSYVIGVESPLVSGFEHLNTLMCRDTLFDLSDSLNHQEKKRLREADQRLIKRIDVFLAELKKITSMEYERQQRSIPPERWWWYLDVIANLPIPITRADQQEKSLEPAAV